MSTITPKGEHVVFPRGYDRCPVCGKPKFGTSKKCRSCHNSRPVVEQPEDSSIRLIPLFGGKVVIVDAANYEELSRYKWYASRGHAEDVFYAFRAVRIPKENKTVRIPMHRQIMGRIPSGLFVDHVNRNGLDNRRANLRVCTKAQNTMNQKLRADNSSGYKGVRLFKKVGKWRACITIDGREKSLGLFFTPEEAKGAYERAALEYFGKFARAF